MASGSGSVRDGIASIVVVWGVLWAMIFATLYLLRTLFGIG